MTWLNATPIQPGYACMSFKGIPAHAMAPIFPLSISEAVLKNCSVTLQLTSDVITKWFTNQIIKQNKNSLLHPKDCAEWIKNINCNKCFHTSPSKSYGQRLSNKSNIGFILLPCWLIMQGLCNNTKLNLPFYRHTRLPIQCLVYGLNFMINKWAR